MSLSNRLFHAIHLSLPGPNLNTLSLHNLMFNATSLTIPPGVGTDDHVDSEAFRGDRSPPSPPAPPSPLLVPIRPDPNLQRVSTCLLRNWTFSVMLRSDEKFLLRLPHMATFCVIHRSLTRTHHQITGFICLKVSADINVVLSVLPHRVIVSPCENPGLAAVFFMRGNQSSSDWRANFNRSPQWGLTDHRQSAFMYHGDYSAVKTDPCADWFTSYDLAWIEECMITLLELNWHDLSHTNIE